MLIRALCLILSLLMVLPAPAIVSATVYWASPTGSNTATCADIDSAGTAEAPGSDPGSYGTIGRAAACANTAGDVVNIKAGTYTGTNHKITSGAMFASGSSDSVRTVIQGNPGGAVPQINIPNWFTTDEASSTHRNYFTLQDVSVSGSGGGDSGGGELSIEGAYILVQRVTITNSYNMNIASFTGSDSANNHHHVYRNNSLQNAGSGDGCGYGIYDNADDVTIENNEIFGGKCGGVQVYADSFPADRPLIRNNYIHDIAKATQANVLNLCFGIAVNGADAVAYNNILDGSGCGGGASGDGIDAGYQTSNVLKAYNNIIYGWAGYGINYGHFATTTGNLATNNLIVGNGGTIANASSNGSSITNTTNRTTGSITDCTGTLPDFTHKVGSACIDAGTSVATVTDDHIGTARPQNSVFDIGAYEYIVSAGGGSGGMSETPSWSSPRRHPLFNR